jgi:hypothetical protein
MLSISLRIEFDATFYLSRVIPLLRVTASFPNTKLEMILIFLAENTPCSKYTRCNRSILFKRDDQ